MTNTFWIENPNGNEELLEFSVGTKIVASFNHDEDGWHTMKVATELFENVAKAVGAKVKRL